MFIYVRGIGRIVYCNMCIFGEVPFYFVFLQHQKRGFYVTDSITSLENVGLGKDKKRYTLLILGQHENGIAHFTHED